MISRTSASIHRKKNFGRHKFLPFVFLRNSRYTVVVVSETNTFTWKVKKATAKSSEDSEMQVKAALGGFVSKNRRGMCGQSNIPRKAAFMAPDYLMVIRICSWRSFSVLSGREPRTARSPLVRRRNSHGEKAEKKLQTAGRGKERSYTAILPNAGSDLEI